MLVKLCVLQLLHLQKIRLIPKVPVACTADSDYAKVLKRGLVKVQFISLRTLEKTPDIVIKQVQDKAFLWKYSSAFKVVVKLEIYPPDQRKLYIYDELECSFKCHSMDELLNINEYSTLCQGLPSDLYVMSVVVPASKGFLGNVLHHTITKVQRVKSSSKVQRITLSLCHSANECVLRCDKNSLTFFFFFP